MKEIKNFTPEVCEKLKYYVYRLIDPRNGETFYVGKGKGNRVFAHVYDALNNYEGENYNTSKSENEGTKSTKIETIREIHRAGLNVIHVIQRWGIESEKTAYEVESALIDCYFGLSNAQAGHDKDFGVTNASILQETLSCREYDEPDFKYLIIKVSEATLESNNQNLYETVRSSWRINKKKVSDYKVCFAVINGIVKEVYDIEKWEPDSKLDNKRFFFTGKPTEDEEKKTYINKRIPAKYRTRGLATPVQYAPR